MQGPKFEISILSFIYFDKSLIYIFKNEILIIKLLEKKC
jgi:hypothetical protein